MEISNPHRNINFELPADLYDKFHAFAKKNHRSKAAELRNLIEAAVQEDSDSE